MTGVQQQILTNQLLNQMVSGQAGVGNFGGPDRQDGYRGDVGLNPAERQGGLDL